MLTFQKYVHFMRTQFPPGSRVLLLSNDQPKPVPDGTMGTLTEIDSAGRFLVNWDNGKRTALNMEDDHFRIFQSDPMELKLKLFFQWGISFGEPYTVPDKGNRPVAYAGKEALVQAIQEKYPPQEEPQQPKAKEQPPQPGPEDKKLHASSPGRRQTKPGKEREDDRP